MDAIKLPEYTIDDILALPEGQRAELINDSQTIKI